MHGPDVSRHEDANSKAGRVRLKARAPDHIQAGVASCQVAPKGHTRGFWGGASSFPLKIVRCRSIIEPRSAVVRTLSACRKQIMRRWEDPRKSI